MLASPSNVGVPRLCIGVPLVVYPMAALKGGRGVCCAVSCSDWVWHLALSRSPSHCQFPSYRSYSSSVLCCRVCCGWGSGVVCGGGSVSRPCSSLLSLCSLLQYCWFVLCLCGRVVSLWNSGDGLCWGRIAVVGWVCSSRRSSSLSRLPCLVFFSSLLSSSLPLLLWCSG